MIYFSVPEMDVLQIESPGSINLQAHCLPTRNLGSLGQEMEKLVEASEQTPGLQRRSKQDMLKGK
jgi:hypothetical protein